MRILTVMLLVSSRTWLGVVAAAPGPDSPETNEADHSHSAGGCDCMEYWTCVMRYGTPDDLCVHIHAFGSISVLRIYLRSYLLFQSLTVCIFLLLRICELDAV